MNEITINDDTVSYDTMIWLGTSDLMKEIYICSQGEHMYWYYRNVLIQAQERGLVRITGHSNEIPFWWRKFDESIEILSEQLKTAISDGSLK